MNAATPAALHAHLLDLRDALDGEDYGSAGELLALHDRRMRQYIDTVGLQAPMQALRELLRMQHLLHEDPRVAPRPYGLSS